MKDNIADIFKDDTGEIPHMDKSEGPIILKEEVRKAINYISH